MRYAYYPGCTQESSGKSYDVSARQAFSVLGIELEEIRDWNCCGSTPGPSVDPVFSTIMCSRNLALAEEMGMDVAVICSACYASLRRCLDQFQTDPRLREKISTALSSIGRKFSGNIRIKNVLEILVEDYGLDRIADRVTKPLEGLRVAPYYGCLMVRPRTSFDDPEYPTSMDRLLRAIGAYPVPYPHRVKCCGGALVNTKEESALKLVEELLRDAKDNEADVICVACPMCQFNLDCYQDKINALFGTSYRIPVVYVTQLLGLALGVDSRRLGLSQNLVSPMQALRV